jgi:TonB family protein
MDFFSDTQETASRFADYVEDLQDVFRCHGVDFGSAEDFFALARTMKYHSELRGDVLRVVKSVMESETNISFRTILTIIAVASGGPEVATSGREMSIPVKLLIESLIGVGACRQLDSDHPGGLYSELTMKETAREVAPDTVLSRSTEAMAHAEAEEPVLVDRSSRGGPEAIKYAEVPGGTDPGGVIFEKSESDSSIGPSLPRQGLPSQSLPGQPSSSNGSSGLSNGHEGLLNDYSGSNTLAESLTRLELNSLQLKIYLDSIDQRISRMEPRLENVAPIALSTPPLLTREEGTARFSAVVPAASIPAETVSAATISADAETRSPHDDPHMPNPQDRVTKAGGAGPVTVPGRLWRDSGKISSFRRRGVLPALVGVAMLLVAAALFWSFGRDNRYAVVNPVSASANAGGVRASPPASSSSSDPRAGGSGVAQVAGVSDPSAASGVSAAGKGSQGDNLTAASPYTRQGVSRPVDVPTPSSTPSSRTPARTPFTSSSPSSGSPAGDEARAEPEMANDLSDVEAPAVRTYKLSSVPPSGHLVNVSSGVMAANLLSGPKPSYPTLASLTHTQGNVVLQAVISKSGTVEHLRVIKGHRLLRGAAKSAVQNWRYRPYKVGGVPVEVATIVSVDFSLHR